MVDKLFLCSSNLFKYTRVGTIPFMHLDQQTILPFWITLYHDHISPFSQTSYIFLTTAEIPKWTCSSFSNILISKNYFITLTSLPTYSCISHVLLNKMRSLFHSLRYFDIILFGDVTILRYCTTFLIPQRFTTLVLTAIHIFLISRLHLSTIFFKEQISRARLRRNLMMRNYSSLFLWAVIWYSEHAFRWFLFSKSERITLVSPVAFYSS